jgi:hypothetical protein
MAKARGPYRKAGFQNRDKPVARQPKKKRKNLRGLYQKGLGSYVGSVIVWKM